MGERQPPLAEMSIAVQFASKIDFGPSRAFELAKVLSDRFPVLELKERVQVLGGAPAPEIVFGNQTAAPRWWMSSSDSAYLAQFQDDLVAINWRRQVSLGQPVPVAYPGFDEMLRTFVEILDVRQNLAPAEEVFQSCNLHYEDMWLLDGGKSIGDVFSFWKTLGISGQMHGPDIRWGLGLPEVGAGARLDMHASLGIVTDMSPPTRAARLALSGFAAPDSRESLMAALKGLHDGIHGYLPALTTDSAREGW